MKNLGYLGIFLDLGPTKMPPSGAEVAAGSTVWWMSSSTSHPGNPEGRGKGLDVQQNRTSYIPSGYVKIAIENGHL